MIKNNKKEYLTRTKIAQGKQMSVDVELDKILIQYTFEKRRNNDFTIEDKTIKQIKVLMFNRFKEEMLSFMRTIRSPYIQKIKILKAIQEIKGGQ